MFFNDCYKFFVPPPGPYEAPADPEIVVYGALHVLCVCICFYIVLNVLKWMLKTDVNAVSTVFTATVALLISTPGKMKNAP